MSFHMKKRNAFRQTDRPFRPGGPLRSAVARPACRGGRRERGAAALQQAGSAWRRAGSAGRERGLWRDRRGRNRGRARLPLAAGPGGAAVGPGGAAMLVQCAGSTRTAEAGHEGL